jgi:hypothetical protein
MPLDYSSRSAKAYENGRYLFLVMQGKKVIHSKIILASKLSLSFTGAKTLSWPKVIQ